MRPPGYLPGVALSWNVTLASCTIVDMENEMRGGSPPESAGRAATIAAQNSRVDQQPDGRSLTWKRLSLILLLVNTPLFYHGCDSGDTYFTLGAAAPCVELTYADGGVLPDQAKMTSPWLWCANVFLLVATLWLIRRAFPRLRRIVVSQTFLVALLIVILLMNSFLYASVIWMNVIWSVNMQFLVAVHWLILHDVTDHAAENGVDVALASRLHFFCMLAAVYLVLRLLVWIYNRFVAVDSQRWWQLRLGGLIGAMLILGAGIGMLLRYLIALSQS